MTSRSERHWRVGAAARRGRAAPTTSCAPATGSYDLDGDGRGDDVHLTPVPDMGWSSDVTPADGRQTSPPLPLEDDVELLEAGQATGVDPEQVALDATTCSRRDDLPRRVPV